MSRNHQSKDTRRPSGHRTASGAWNRLKPINIDPLDVYGLPSKGEKRLHNFKTQEEYHGKIVDRYMKFCASFADGEQLEHALASLRVTAAASVLPASKTQSRNPSSSSASTAKVSQMEEMSMITMAMRKLREGCLGSRRRDSFAQKAYMFIVHVSILSRQWESYVPALRYLLQEVHPVTPLSQPDFEEFSNYHILDLACRQNNLLEAYTAKKSLDNHNRKVSAVLKAMTHDNWVRYWRVLHAVDGYQRAIMEFNTERIRLHILKCIGRSYLSAEKSFVEHSANASWSELVEQGIGWDLQGDTVIIRKPKAR